jgi:uroporphyrinogen-III decarboxylase
MDKTVEDLLREREKRVNDAIALKQPDRIPVICLFGFFPAKLAGMTYQEAMYDYDKTMRAWVNAMVEFEPDMFDDPYPGRFWGKIFEALDFKQLKWPGQDTKPMSSFQFVENQYMKEEEYDHFLSDHTDFMLRRYWPRIFGALGPLKDLPPVKTIYSYMWLGKFLSLDTPAISEAIENLLTAVKEVRKMVSGSEEYGARMKQLGFPPQFGCATHAPFDVISDFFRGTKGAMLDMYRRPEKLLEAVDQMLPVMLQNGLLSKQRGIPRVFIPLHKGIDGFMSQAQFNMFYWPTLKKLILGLIDEGLNPVVFWEGDCTSRLETIKDIPKGKVVYMFERTNMFKAKEVLGDTVCIRGNVPLSILSTGTPDDVKTYCRKLIDIVGKGGGFIMDSSTVLDDAKPENVKAMFDFTKEYGRYS